MRRSYLCLFIGYLFLLCSFPLSPDAFSAINYDIRAQTRDRAIATIYAPSFAAYTVGKVRQGSFGAPSINAKGAVAYACILIGRGITAFTSNSVLVCLPGKKKIAHMAVQSGDGSILSNTFIVNPLGVANTARMYRISRDVAINDKNQIAFAGEMLHLVQPPLAPAFTTNVATYGWSGPLNKNASQFVNNGLVTYGDFEESFFQRTVSINSRGSTAFDSRFYITPDKEVGGFGYAFPGYSAAIATVESPVIGLPYFTTFQSFSNAIIANGNVAYVVADISDAGAAFDGIWQGNNPNIQPVVVKNTVAPGGGEFISFGGRVGPSRNGKVLAFTATTSSGSGVFRVNKNGKNLIEVARVGDKAPLNSASGQLGNFTTFSLTASNDNGQVAVLGSVDGEGSREGIWLSDKNGEKLSLIVIEGQSIQVRKKLKQVVKIAFNPVSGLNRKGQVAFTASFDDRTSAVIVAKL